MNNNNITNHKMKDFPENLRPKYRHLFDQLAFDQQLQKWRQKVFSYIIHHETRGLTITDDNYQKIDSKVLSTIINELNELGWKTKLAFNGTVLFIFEQEEEIENFKHVISDDIIDEPVI